MDIVIKRPKTTLAALIDTLPNLSTAFINASLPICNKLRLV